MNTTNNKIRTKQNKFRSSTDVNNYNKFLLELDNQQMKQIKETKEVKEVKEMQKIDDYLKNVNQVYEKYTLPINQTNKKTDIVDKQSVNTIEVNSEGDTTDEEKELVVVPIVNNITELV